MEVRSFLKITKKKVFVFIILYSFAPFFLVFLFLPVGSSFLYIFIPFLAPICLAVSIFFLIEGGLLLILPFIFSLLYLVFFYVLSCLIFFYYDKKRKNKN
ncbi:MAG: hypothetical protein Q7R99_00010 [bacterium]|nr:hypothetical protein [bacterium]